MYKEFTGAINVMVRVQIRQIHVLHAAAHHQQHNGKGKLHSRTDHESPEGKQRCSSVLSLTSLLYCSGWSKPRAGCFTPGKRHGTSQQVGWTPGSAWTGTENLDPTRIRSPDRSARSQSLYRLLYNDPYHQQRSLINFVTDFSIARPSVPLKIVWRRKKVRSEGTNPQEIRRCKSRKIREHPKIRTELKFNIQTSLYSQTQYTMFIFN